MVMRGDCAEALPFYVEEYGEDHPKVQHLKDRILGVVRVDGVIIQNGEEVPVVKKTGQQLAFEYLKKHGHDAEIPFGNQNTNAVYRSQFRKANGIKVKRGRKSV